MNITLAAFAVLCLGCSPSKPAEDAKRAAACVVVERSYTEAANGVIDAGTCDKHERIEDCPPYRAIEELYTASIRELRCQ
jgi:hypothetical protein